MDTVFAEVSGPDENGKYWVVLQPSSGYSLGPFDIKADAEYMAAEIMPNRKEVIEPPRRGDFEGATIHQTTIARR